MVRKFEYSNLRVRKSLPTGLDRISLKQLRALSEVARAENIVAAADVLGLTGPAVHSQLRTLQSALGVDLLSHEGRRKNRPTAEGEVLIRAYARVATVLERALSDIEDIAQGRAGSVVLGVVSTAKYFAPDIVARLQAEMPELQIRLKVANRQETIAALARGEFDLCIMGRPPREPLVEATPLGENPHVLIAAPDNPLAGRADVSLADLAIQRFVLREEGSGTRSLAMRFLADMRDQQAFEPVVMDSNETIKQAVMSGLGIALISAHTIAQEVHDGRLKVLSAPGVPITRQWYLLHGSPDPLTASASRVHDWLTERGPALFPRIAV